MTRQAGEQGRSARCLGCARSGAARKRWRGGAWAGALALCLAGLVGCGENVTRYRTRGDAAYSAGQWLDARDNYDAYLRVRGQELEVRRRLGNSLSNLGRHTDAVSELKIAHSQAPRDAGVLDDLGRAMLAAGRGDELLSMLRGYAEQYAGAEDWVRLGRFATRAGDYDTARTALLTGARLDRGQSVGPQLALYEFYLRLGDRESAVQRLRMAHYLDPLSLELRAVVRGEGLSPTTDLGIKPTEQLPIDQLPPL